MSMEAVSPRKRALMPTGDLRRRLRAHGHSLKPLVQVGKSGVTTGVLAQVAQALFDHELVKVRIGTECPQDRFEVADELAAQPGTQVVQILGRVVLVYKRHPEKPRYEGKGARAEGGEGVGARGPAKRGKAADSAKPERRAKK
ncbi:MAG TPA: ribosome assembly RNA-binding protein YhbY [Polyangia bacterium]|jgi:RNA-binding protein|nr:ribosome assembly RNA-binding protein YhbY [Polyangia bacterium]